MKGMCLIEKDWQNDVSIVWSFPAIDELQSRLVLSRTNQFLSGSEPPFVVSRCGRYFLYMLWSNRSISRDVTAFGVCIFAKDYNPKFYEANLRLMADTYAERKSPVPMLEHYLNFTITDKSGEVDKRNFDKRKVLTDEDLTGCFFEMIKDLGADWILLWSAVIFKKRLAIISEDPANVMKLVGSMCFLAIHRQKEIFQHIHPIAGPGKIEHLHLSKTPYWIAGFTQKSQVKSFDVLFDAESKSIEIHKDSQTQFQMCKFQKDICKKVLDVSGSTTSAADVIKVITAENGRLLEIIKQIGSPLTREVIEEKGFASKTTHFLITTAQSEGLLK